MATPHGEPADQQARSGHSDARGRRNAIERAWTRWRDRREAPAGVDPDIVSSWERSAATLPAEIGAAPLDDESATAASFAASPLSEAVTRLEGELRSAAEDGDLVVAVTDAETRILWTWGGRVMRRTAEDVNFVPGGRWDEASVGTNALNLALRTNRVTTVFSAEHYAPIVHNWVCWAAPIHDPATGEKLGVLDLSTTWDRAHPIGAATAQVLARLLEREIPAGAPGSDPRVNPTGGLRLRLLGAVEAHLDGHRLLVTRRQAEILALLSMHPQGLSLGELHALLYGDQQVSAATLRAEVSHLRSALGGRLASRPYRLDLPVSTDVADVDQAIAQGRAVTAVRAYGGDLVPGTSSPALTEKADYLAVAVRECLLADPVPEAVLRYSEIAPSDTEVVQRALERLGEGTHPAKAALAARLASQGR